MPPIVLLLGLLGFAQLYLLPDDSAAQAVGRLLVAVALPLAVVVALGGRARRTRHLTARSTGVPR
ncbi:MAG: hypothetical protein GWO02_04750 [Gammaproteobacteria bacterium]|nr:hypothetical protein [Gammaproteobacteria bacterium]